MAANSLLDLVEPGQPWLPGSPVGNPERMRQIDSRLNASSWWQRPQRDYRNPNFNPLAAFQMQPRQGFDTQGRPVQAAGGGTGGAGQSVGPFTAQTLVRNPQLAAMLDRLYGQIGSLSTDPNQNQTVLHRNTKLQEIERAGQSALSQQQADANNNAQSIADFAKNFMALQPQVNAAAQQEAGAIGRIYDGGYAGDLANNLRRMERSSTENLQRRLGSIAAGNRLGEMARGGVTNSFADAAMMRSAADASIARDMAMQEQERANIMDVMNRQLGAAGMRQRLLDSAAQRELVPIEAGQRVANNDLNRLGAISNMLMANNVFTPQTQAGMLGQVQQLLSGQASLDPSAYWRFVQGDFPENMPGVVGQSNFRLPPVNFGGGSPVDFQSLIGAINQQYGAQPSLPSPRTTPTRGSGWFPGQPYPIPQSELDPYAGMIPAAAAVPRAPYDTSFGDVLDDYMALGYNASDIANWIAQMSPERRRALPRDGYE